MSKDKIDPARIRNKNIKGCIICQNEGIAEIVDSLIINAEMDLKTMREHLQTYDYYIDAGTLQNHIKHVFIEDVVAPPHHNNATEKDEIVLASNLDIVKDTLASLIVLERKYLNEGKENTKEFFAILSEKRRMIEMKAKLEGELDSKDDGVFKLPAYISKME